MAGNTEMSFGAKLRRAYDVLAVVQKLEVYQPPRPEEHIENFTAFVKNLETLNVSANNLGNQYKFAVDQRTEAFRSGNESMEKSLVQIRGAVEAQFGKKSTQMTIIAGIIRKIRSTKLMKTPADPTKPSSEHAISDSQRSFGSSVQFYNDLVTSLESFPEYVPSNEKIRIRTLRERFNNLHKLNDNVMSTAQDLQVGVVDRKALFEELKNRVNRIKAYVKAQYGIKSEPYSILKKLRF